MASSKATVGGQAFPVGILMRGKRNAVAYCQANGEINVETWPKKTRKLPETPVVRGLLSLASSMVDSAVTTATLIKTVKDPAKNGSTVTRVRKYHGAEHKTIACYEQGLELTPENVAAQSRIHPRCGTTVAVTALITHGLISSAIPRKMDPLKRQWLGLACEYLSLGISYELCRKAWRGESQLAQKLTAPGRWAQKYTTAEPDEEMIRCAIAALNAATDE